MKKFDNQKSVLKKAIKHNTLNDVNCWYTIGGHENNSITAERMMLDKMGPMSNFPKGSMMGSER